MLKSQALMTLGAFTLTLAVVQAQRSSRPPDTSTNAEGKRVQEALASRPASPPLTAQDYADIQLLYARAAHGLDSGAANGNMYADVFTPDGIFIDTPTGKVYQGRDQLAELVRMTASGAKGVRHLFQNVMIEHSLEGAFVKAYVAILQIGPVGQPATAIDSGQYWDVLVRTPEGWRFKKRNFHRATPAVPGLPAPAVPARPSN